MAGADVIDDYVTALGRRLRGPGHVKDDLLAEARDSLHDAARAHLDAGLADEAAQRRAVAEFGPVGEIARDYQGVLGLAHGARTLWTVLFVVPLAHVLWELNREFWIGSWAPFDVRPPDWYLAVARAHDNAAWFVAAGVLVALVAGRVLARRGASTATLARLAGAVAVGAVGTSALGHLAIMAATAHLDVSRLVTPPPVSAASVASLVVVLRLGVLARRSVVFSSV